MTGEERTVRLTVSQTGQRLDRYLAEAIPELSRTMAQRLIRKGLVTVNGQTKKASHRVEKGELIVVHIPPPEPLALEPEPIPLDIVYEDADILVVNKPAGMVVHPAAGHRSGTLVNALLAHCPDVASTGEVFRPGIVHRLDKDTSGLIIVAKNERARLELQRQFKAHQVEKRYLALVEGRLEPPQGVVKASIGRDPRHRKRMAVVEGGREAITEYRVIEYLPQHTLVEIRPRTGRTHQIRVHMAWLGHPVAGDPVYGHRRGLPLPRQFLHAYALEIRLPSTGKPRRFQAPLPPELQAVLDELRQGSGS